MCRIVDSELCLFHPFSFFFYARFVANLSLGPSLHRERPLLRSCGWSFASCQPPSHSDTHLFSASRCRKCPLSRCTESCFFYLEEWRLKSPIDIHLNSPRMLRLRQFHELDGLDTIKFQKEGQESGPQGDQGDLGGPWGPHRLPAPMP